MLRLSAILFILVGPVMAGIFVLVATAVPQLGLYSLDAMGWLAGAGFLVAIPLSILLAKMLPPDLVRAAAK